MLPRRPRHKGCSSRTFCRQDREALSRFDATEITDGAAKILASHQDGLGLNGLTELSDAAAESLSKHRGDLDLSGLTELSDAAAGDTLSSF